MKWERIDAEYDWQEYTGRFAAANGLNRDEVSWGPGPPYYPAMACSYYLTPNRVLTAFFGMHDAEMLLPVADDVQESDASVVRDSFDLATHAVLAVIVHYLHATGLVKDTEAFFSDIDELISLYQNGGTSAVVTETKHTVGASAFAKLVTLHQFIIDKRADDDVGPYDYDPEEDI